MYEILGKIGGWIRDLVKRPFAWLLAIFSVIVELCYSLFSWISSMVFDITVDSFPEVDNLVKTDLFQYLITTFQLHDFFTRLTAYVILCMACYASHFVGIPVSYALRVIRLR